eukprot:m.220320 g.220320  ORF g.220320 m.220320 type:complete len:760 (+) comp31005_c0_seq1:208-2487(+)
MPAARITLAAWVPTQWRRHRFPLPCSRNMPPLPCGAALHYHTPPRHAVLVTRAPNAHLSSSSPIDSTAWAVSPNGMSVATGKPWGQGKPLGRVYPPLARPTISSLGDQHGALDMGGSARVSPIKSQSHPLGLRGAIRASHGHAVDSPSVCRGCGAPLQTDNPDALGYIPAHLLPNHGNDTQATSHPVDDAGNGVSVPWPDGMHSENSDDGDMMMDRLPNNNTDTRPIEYDDGTAAALAEWDAAMLASDGHPPTNRDIEGTNIAPRDDDVNRANMNADARATSPRHGAPTRVVCARCHSLRHHSAPPTDTTTVKAPPVLCHDPATAEPTNGTTTTASRPQSPHVQVCVVDVFDLCSTLGATMRAALSDQAVATVLVVNKVDLLPSDAKRAQRRLIEWLRAQPEYNALPTHVDAVHFVSAHTGWGLPRLLRRLCRLCGHHGSRQGGVRFVGLTNAGKSTLVNRLLLLGRRQQQPDDRQESTKKTQRSSKDKERSQSGNKNHHKNTNAQVREDVTTEQHGDVTTSPVAGTTLGDLAFQLVCNRKRGGPRLMPVHGSDGLHGAPPTPTDATTYPVYDTPGIVDPDHVTRLLTPAEQSAVFTTKCRPVIHTLKRGDTLLFGGLGRIDYVEGTADHVIVVAFASPKIVLHRAKRRRADELLAALQHGEALHPEEVAVDATHKTVHLAPPFLKARSERFPPLDNTRDFTMTGRGWMPSDAVTDIVLPGIGWGMLSVGKGKRVKLQASVTPGHPPALRSPIEPVQPK